MADDNEHWRLDHRRIHRHPERPIDQRTSDRWAREFELALEQRGDEAKRGARLCVTL